jgi:hypothetical protein
MTLRAFLIPAALVMLSACAAETADTNSADYGVGYSDGCASGSSADSHPRGRVTRDEQAFRSNADYKAGWRTGYNACLVRTGRDPFERGRERDPRF